MPENLLERKSVFVSKFTIAKQIYESLNTISNWSTGFQLPYYGIAFGKCTTSAIDTAISSLRSDSNWKDVLYLARLSELDNYWSTTVEDAVKDALDNIPMFNNYAVPKHTDGWFWNWFRTYLEGYRYAEKLNYQKAKWNKQSGFNGLKAVKENTTTWDYHVCNPDTLEIETTYRWHQTGALCGVWLKFENYGILDARAVALDMWTYLNNTFWMGDHYNYSSYLINWEMTAPSVFWDFSRLWIRENNNLTNWTRVVTDIQNRYLANKWDSPQWGTYKVVIHHNPSNTQRRLDATFDTWVLLHMFYPFLNDTNKSNMKDLLLGTTVMKASDALLRSELFENNRFRTANNTDFDDLSTAKGCVTLFYMAICPDTGYLAVPLIIEGMSTHDNNNFNTEHFSFIYDARKIKIPVVAGSLKFTFGTQTVSHTFDENGIYEITFSDDWNSISNVTKVSGLLTNKYDYVFIAQRLRKSVFSIPEYVLQRKSVFTIRAHSSLQRKSIFSIVEYFLQRKSVFSVPEALWLSGWPYRKRVIISGASGAGTNYQILLKVGESSGATGAHFHVENHCTDFPNDIRFTRDDKVTLLSYWLEEVTGASPNRVAKIWVKVSDNLDSNVNIYCYYGKAGESSASNGDSTFLLFDHFEGSSLNPDKWTVIEGDISVSGSNLVLSGTSGTRGNVRSNATFSYGTAVHTRAKQNNAIGQLSHYCGFLDSNNAVDSYSANTADNLAFICMREGSYTRNIFAVADLTLYHHYKVTWRDVKCQFFQDDTLKNEITTNIPTVELKVAFLEGSSDGKDTYVDWMFVTKFVDPEPHFESAGNEEEKVFYIISISADPTKICREGAVTSTLRCDWHDEQDLPAGSYICKFYTRAPTASDYSFVGTGTVVKEGTKEYHATYDWDPADSAETGFYDVKAKVRKT